MQDLTDLSIIKGIMAKFGFKFSKGLGQNFLINPEVCPKIAEMGIDGENYGVIEIGTGFGVLTKELAKRAEKVVAIEIDKRLIPVLDYTLSEFKNVKVINKDFMEVDIQKLIDEEFCGMKVAVCANLPYYITSPVIMRLLESGADVKSVTVMVQKEVADRLCAPVGGKLSGAVTVAINYYGETELLFNVGKESFMPSPKVDSAVIRIDVDKDKQVDIQDEEFFFKVVRAGFEQRRKTLANSLSASLGIDKEYIYSVLDETGIRRDMRAERLTMDELILLSKNLKTAFN